MMVKNSVKEVVEISVSLKVLKEFLSMVKAYNNEYGAYANIVNFTSDGSIKATDGYSFYTIDMLEGLTNTSVNIDKKKLIEVVMKDIKKLPSIIGNMEGVETEVLKELSKLKDGLITIKIEPSTQTRLSTNTSYYSKATNTEKILQDKVSVYLNNVIVGVFYQDVELTFPDLERVVKGMNNIHTEVAIPKTSKETLIKELKESIKMIKKVSCVKKVPLIHMDILSKGDIINFSTEFFDLDNREHDLNFSIEGIVKGDELNCKIDALKFLNYLENESLPNIHIEVNNRSNSFQDCFKLNCSVYKSKFIMLIRP